MSKDMIGSVVRAAVGVPQARLDTLAKLASAMSDENPQGEVWHKHLKQLLKTGLSSSAPAPATFEVNEHGHMVFTITGLDLSGVEEIVQLESAEYRVSDYSKQILTSTNDDSYDANHRLVAGKQYKIVLLPGKHISRDADRSTANLRAEGAKFGYGKPLAGIVPRIREVVSDEKMVELGIWYIVALHESIKDAGDDPHVLGSHRHGDGRRVRAYRGRPDGEWGDGGAFAFFAPAS